MVGACLSINAETLERTSIPSLVNKYIVKVKRYIVQFLHNVSNLKLEARKIYMHKQSYLPAGKAGYIAYLCHSQDSLVPGRESTSCKTRQENKDIICWQ